jgi:hypothetical protein
MRRSSRSHRRLFLATIRNAYSEFGQGLTDGRHREVAQYDFRSIPILKSKVEIGATAFFRQECACFGA